MALGKDLRELDGTGVEVLHFDVMDGCFCPMMTVGPPFIKAVRSEFFLKDVHLMVQAPLEKLASYVDAGADIITVHFESDPVHIHRVLQHLGSLENRDSPGRGIVRGIALNPGTPIHVLEPLLGEVDLITLLGINPGWKGQLLPATATRVAQVRELISGSNLDILIGVDGGITKGNLATVAAWGADLVVTGSAVFDGVSPNQNARSMLESLRASRA